MFNSNVKFKFYTLYTVILLYYALSFNVDIMNLNKFSLIKLNEFNSV